MRILLDEDVYAVTGRFLKALNHKVISAQELGRDALMKESFVPPWSSEPC